VLPGRNRSQEEVDRLVELRLERQELLAAEEPPHVYFVLDEAAIRRVVGSPDVMGRQLRRLLELTELPTVEVLIKPFSQGVYPGWRCPFVHFEFARPDDEDVLYIESASGELVVREGSVAQAHNEMFAPTKCLNLFWDIEAGARAVDGRALIERAIQALES
jgi:hypothetical protein